MKINVKDLSYMALYGALALTLEFVSGWVPFLQMPQGGSVNLGVIPVFIASYHLGWKKGMCVGGIWWFLGFLMGMNAWYLNPMQYSLDYLLPVVICGAASFFPKIGEDNIFVGVVFAMVLKYTSHILSGVYYWPPEGEVAGSIQAWTFSLIYNLGYNLATLIVAIILVPICLKQLSRLKLVFVGVKN